MFLVINTLTQNSRKDKSQRSKWIKNAGSSSISAKQLEIVFNKLKIKNYELVKGDVLKTLPKIC